MNNYTNFPTSYFTATIDTNGQIYAFEASGQRIVGVVSKIFEETRTQRDNAISKAEELYKLCVDNGIIKPDPTQEEVLKKALDEIQQTRKENQAIMEMNAKLVELVESMKRDNAISPPSVLTEELQQQTKKQNNKSKGVNNESA